MKKSIKNLETKAIQTVTTVKGGEPGDRYFYHWGSTVTTQNP